MFYSSYTWPIFLGVGSSSSTNIWLQIQPRLTLRWDPRETLLKRISCCFLEIIRSPPSQPGMMEIMRSTWRTEQLSIVEKFFESVFHWMLGLDVRVMMPREETDSNSIWGKTPLEGNAVFSVVKKQEREWFIGLRWRWITLLNRLKCWSLAEAQIIH